MVKDMNCPSRLIQQVINHAYAHLGEKSELNKNARRIDVVNGLCQLH